MIVATHPAWRHARILFVALALLVSGCAAGPSAASARAVPESFAPLVKKVLPAVVNIAVTETVSGGDMFAQLPPELRARLSSASSATAFAIAANR